VLNTVFHVVLFIVFAVIQRVTIGSAVALQRDRQVLLVRSSYKAGWTLPGGMLAPPESFEACARRELREELALTVEQLELADILNGATWPSRRNYVAVFRAALPDEVFLAPASWEVADARWFPHDDLPADVPKFTRACIERAFASVPSPALNAVPTAAPVR
jgi:ADP-ribose pyrophosphatase YjhB (NUDIX family)